MRSHLASCSLLLFAAACNKSSSDAPAPAERPADKPAAAPAPAQAPAPAPTPTPAPAADSFDAHMKAGEKAENAKKWEEARSEFAAAVAARPDDAKALTEATWCADHTDDQSDAQTWGANAVKASRKTKDPDQLAMALYDLARSWMKLDPHAARSLIAASLDLRPNATVAQAMDSLSPRAGGTADGDALLEDLGVPPSKIDTSPPARNQTDVDLITELNDSTRLTWADDAFTLHLDCHAGHASDTCQEVGVPDGKGFYADGDAGDTVVQLLIAKGIENTMNDGSHLLVDVTCHEDPGGGTAGDSCTVTRVKK